VITFAEPLGEGVRIAVIGDFQFPVLDPGCATWIANEESHPLAPLLESSDHETSHAAGRPSDDNHDFENSP
jgi:hypothetical protein